MYACTCAAAPPANAAASAATAAAPPAAAVCGVLSSQAEQQRLVERFIDYAEQVRGAQLHLLREHDGSPVEQRFLQQVELLQRPFAATDAAADITGQSRANSSSNGISYGISNGSTSMAASVGTKECLRGQHPSFVRFRLIEGAVSSLVLGPGGGSGCGSQVQMRTSSGFQGGDSDAVTHGSSTISTNGEGEEEETLFACQLESFLQLAVNEIATNELMGWEGQAETKNAAAVQLRCRRVVMAGALVPLALDDTLVIEHKVTLRRGTVSSTSNKAPQANGAPPEGTPSGALDIAGDTERLRDTLHQHAYQGCLRVPVTDQFKVNTRTVKRPKSKALQPPTLLCLLLRLLLCLLQMLLLPMQLRALPPPGLLLMWVVIKRPLLLLAAGTEGRETGKYMSRAHGQRRGAGEGRRAQVYVYILSLQRVGGQHCLCAGTVAFCCCCCLLRLLLSSAALAAFRCCCLLLVLLSCFERLLRVLFDVLANSLKAPR